MVIPKLDVVHEVLGGVVERSLDPFCPLHVGPRKGLLPKRLARPFEVRVHPLDGEQLRLVRLQHQMKQPGEVLGVGVGVLGIVSRGVVRALSRCVHDLGDLMDADIEGRRLWGRASH